MYIAVDGSDPHDFKLSLTADETRSSTEVDIN